MGRSHAGQSSHRETQRDRKDSDRIMTDQNVETSSTTFDSTKGAMPDLLRSIREGKTQLPDFQRGWVWNNIPGTRSGCEPVQ